MENKILHNFVDSIKGFPDLKKIDKIKWFVFFKIKIKKFKSVNKKDIKPLFSLAWFDEPKSFDQLWSYLHKKKKVLVKKGKGFVLSREIYKKLDQLYSESISKTKIRKKLEKIAQGRIIIIPPETLKKLPKDLTQHCNELNGNLEAENWISSMLLMRKILPLSIIRKFQKDNRETELKDSNNEYFGSKKLLEKAKEFIQPRTYKELKDIKFLFNGVQHIFTFRPRKTDISPASTRLRVFLEALFR